MAFQGIFRRCNKFVVVRTIRLTANESLAIGTEIDLEKHPVRAFQLRNWFRRRMIGTIGSPWAAAMLKGVKRPDTDSIKKAKEKAKSKTKKKEKVKDNPKLVGLETKEGIQNLVNTLSKVNEKKDDKPSEDKPKVKVKKTAKKKTAAKKTTKKKTAAKKTTTKKSTTVKKPWEQ